VGSPLIRNDTAGVTIAEDAYDWPLLGTFGGRELMVETIDQEWQIDAKVREHRPGSRI